MIADKRTLGAGPAGPHRMALALSCCLCLVLALAQRAGAGVMTVDEVVNVRALPGLDAPRVARLMPGDAVLAGPEADGWRPVADLSGASMGFVHAPLLAPLGHGAPGRPMTVDAVVNVRAGRGLGAARVDRLVPGQAVLAGPEKDGWVAVADASGRPLGFVHAPLLRQVAQAGTPGTPEPAPASASLPTLGGWELKVTPSIAQSVTYDDNVFFKDVADMESLTSPALKVEASDERTTVTASGNLDVYRYRDYDAFDRENGRFDISARHELSQRLSLGLDGFVRRDHTFLDALAETGAVVDKLPRWTRDGQAEAAWRLDERTGIRARAGAYDVAHSREQRRDVHGQRLGTLLSRDLEDARTRLELEGRTRRDAYATGDQRTHGLLAGASWRVSESVTARFMAGADLVRSDLAGNGDAQTDMHPALEASVDWRGERAGLGLAARREHARGSSGEGVERDLLRARASWAFTQRLKGLMAATLQYAVSEGYADEVDNRYLSLQPTLRYELEDGQLELFYAYTALDNSLDGSHKHANRIGVRAVFEFPRDF